MKLTIDASVAIKFLINEPGCDAARQYLPQSVGGETRINYFLSAPVLILLEIHNTFAKKFLRAEIELHTVFGAEPLLKRMLTLDTLNNRIAERARAMSLVAHSWSGQDALPIGQSRKPFNIYDCVYIAHAEQYSTTLLTADAQQAEIARKAFDVPVIFIDAQADKFAN